MYESKDDHRGGKRKNKYSKGKTLCSVNIPEEDSEKMKALAFWIRGSTLQEHFRRAIKMYLEDQDTGTMEIALIAYRKYLRKQNS